MPAADRRKVLYLTAEKFMYGFVSALKTQTALAFKEALRGIDVLVIDDLQFLQGRSTQAEFCHTLNALIDAGRQVVIAADRPPSDLESLDDRVRSRLAGGLVVEMGALGEELRLEILKLRIGGAGACILPSTCRCRCSNIWRGRSRITGAISKARSTVCSHTTR
jgi:chromosomal replication initiator protein